MERYDEDLAENSFFQVLQREYVDVFEQAVQLGWIICAPRTGALPKYALGQDDIFGHVLVPCEELPETHFRTLNDRNVVLNGNVLVLENSVSNPHSVHILFEETYYDDDMRKYKVMCLEDPLYASHAFAPSSCTDLVILNCLRDCVDLLWTEGGGGKVLEGLDILIQDFLLKNPTLEEETLQTLRDLGSALFSEAIQVTLSDPRLGEKTKTDQYLLDAVKLAVETYVLHGIYKQLIKGIAACKAEEDARLNRVIKNLSDLQVRDLDIDPQLFNLTKAKFELASIEGHSTPLGKLGCLKRAILLVTSTGAIVSSDELLPTLLFLVVKANLPNWYAHITFLKFFRFSASSSDSGEQSFNISSLEAAIEHLYSGSLFGSTTPEADSVLQPGCTSSPVLKSMEEALGYNGVDPMARFFECIRLGRVEDVKDILDGKYKPFEKEAESEPSLVESDAQLCHPLCSCDRCEKLMSKPKKDIMPTIHTREERGYTGLHVACIFGRPAIVDMLIDLGADLHATDFRGATPLHYAAQRGHQNAVLLLLHAGADINKCDGDSNTPLHLCSLNGQVACVKALLFYAESVGCDITINAQNNVLDTPLHLASRWGYSAIVELLIDRIVILGLKLKVYNNRKLTALDCAHNRHIARLILDAEVRKDELESYVRIDVNFKSPTGCPEETKLNFDKCTESSEVYQSINCHDSKHMKHIEKMLKAVKVGDVKLACFYLGIEEKTTNSESSLAPRALCHPLCQCSECAPNINLNQESSETFNTMSINACNSDGYSALHTAVTHEHLHLTKVLLSQGADPNQQTSSRRLSSLHIAAQNCNLDIMQCLVTHGAHVDLRDVCGNTALHHCCVRGFDQGVMLLLHWKATKDLLNLSDSTPAQEAEKRGHWHIVEMIFGKTLSY
ncbi:ankyrin repeat domain-containing protein 27 isoform X1 [Procambarus clarkii]|uniref:ankyrin repeat domain-containing protein 27 isoform X1 n=1 Tax=Procambarus clarkii TaxID=6728 RepID=UPI001E673166|nr:ankyrin repeat domain-containing protein 27-like isoform X1 [Procambarus clarkii]